MLFRRLRMDKAAKRWVVMPLCFCHMRKANDNYMHVMCLGLDVHSVHVLHFDWLAGAVVMVGVKRKEISKQATEFSQICIFQ